MQMIYGIHAVEALLQAQPKSIRMLYLQENREDARLDRIRLQAESALIFIKRLSRREMDTLVSEAVQHQGVVAQVDAVPGYTERDLDKITKIDDLLLLILDGVQDPHNLGACLRSANALGVHAVIAPKDRAVGITPSVRKVACGAAELTPFIPVTNLSRTLKRLKDQGVWLVGAAGDADIEISKIDLTGRTAIIIGAEAKGLRRLTREHCDFLAAIPMVGAIESFNVSVATGICLYEVVRQRKLLDK